MLQLYFVRHGESEANLLWEFSNRGTKHPLTEKGRQQVEVLAELQAVHKHFGKIQALQGVDLQVRRGEVLALLGPNGAGKTTAISLLLGRRKPTQGKALLFGQNPQKPQARQRVGVTPQETAFPWVLRVVEVIELVRSHFTNPVSTQELLSRFDLQELAHRQTGGLSGGQQRRLAVALAFAGNPEVVFLDEPTTGLDVEARRGVWKMIREYNQQGGTVLLTTHYLEEAEALATRVVVIHLGRVLAEGSIEEIRARVRLKRVRFKANALPACFDQMQGARENGLCTIFTADSDELVRQLVQQGVAFTDLEVLQASLEEAFLHLTGGQA